MVGKLGTDVSMFLLDRLVKFSYNHHCLFNLFSFKINPIE